MEIKVLDKGFVHLVDYMGDDASIVQAARVSYGKGTKTPSEDEKLIRYLVKNRHTSPLEMVEFKFHVKLPIFVARQWIRHRTANVNEYSGRYSIMTDEFYLPEVLHNQSTTNKQGSGEAHDASDIWHKHMRHACENSVETYKELIEAGVSREEARLVLPLNIYTEWYWKLDLHNLLHFLKLRLDSHAQYEIRQYAQAIATIIKGHCPMTYRAFEDFILTKEA